MAQQYVSELAMPAMEFPAMQAPASFNLTGQYQIAEKWLWSAGFAFDSSPVSRMNRLAALPIDRQLRYGTGIQIRSQ